MLEAQQERPDRMAGALELQERLCLEPDSISMSQVGRARSHDPHLLEHGTNRGISDEPRSISCSRSCPVAFSGSRSFHDLFEVAVILLEFV